MQLATYEIDITIEQPIFGQKVGQCSSGEVWRHNGLSAPKRLYEIVVNVNRQLFSSYAQCLSFLNSTSRLQSAIFAMIFDPATRPLWRHNSKVAHPDGLRKCKQPTFDTDHYTELLRRDQIGKIPTYMEESHVLLCFTTYSNNNNNNSL